MLVLTIDNGGQTLGLVTLCALRLLKICLDRKSGTLCMLYGDVFYMKMIQDIKSKQCLNLAQVYKLAQL